MLEDLGFIVLCSSARKLPYRSASAAEHLVPQSRTVVGRQVKRPFAHCDSITD